jgi:hypothetical protein
MKKKLFIITILALTFTLVFSTSMALADIPSKTIGERLLVSSGSVTFAAGDPFHIMHGLMGWYEIGEPVENTFGLHYMTLEVDGVEIRPDYLDIDWTTYQDYGGRLVTKLYIFNFPEGMTGEHTFVRRYYLTCEYINENITPMECRNPADLVEFTPWMQILHVTFE